MRAAWVLRQGRTARAAKVGRRSTVARKPILVLHGPLNKRLEAATTAVAVDKIKGAIDSLKMAGDCVASTTQGVMAFVWAKASNIVPKRVAGVVKIVTTSSKNRASELSATLTRPATELGFF